jgi:hypothetical protein
MTFDRRRQFDDGDDDGELFAPTMRDFYGLPMDIEQVARLGRSQSPPTLGELQRMRGVETVVEMPRLGHLVIWVQNESVASKIRERMPFGILVDFCVEEEGLLRFFS